MLRLAVIPAVLDRALGASRNEILHFHPLVSILVLCDGQEVVFGWRPGSRFQGRVEMVDVSVTNLFCGPSYKVRGDVPPAEPVVSMVQHEVVLVGSEWITVDERRQFVLPTRLALSNEQTLRTRAVE